MIITLGHLNPKGRHDKKCITMVSNDQSADKGPPRLGIKGLCYFKADSVDRLFKEGMGWSIEVDRPTNDY